MDNEGTREDGLLNGDINQGDDHELLSLSKKQMRVLATSVKIPNYRGVSRADVRGAMLSCQRTPRS